jgi:hypothetical protein
MCSVSLIWNININESYFTVGKPFNFDDKFLKLTDPLVEESALGPLLVKASTGYLKSGHIKIGI